MAAYQGKARELEGLSGGLQDLKNEIQALAANRAKYASQHSENTMAKEELELLDDDAGVFKLIGPALVKQDKSEALDTVNKRLDFIRSTMDGVEAEMAAKEKQFETRKAAAMGLQNELMVMQQKMQQMQLAAAAGGGANAGGANVGGGGSAPSAAAVAAAVAAEKK